MADPIECLKPVIGLAEEKCACIDEAIPQGMDTSLSGLYMDDMDWGISLNLPDQAGDCKGNDVWAMLENARTKGLTDFLTDLQVAVEQEQQRAVRPYRGTIGSEEANKTINQTTPLAGLWIKPHRIKGGYINLHKIVKSDKSWKGQAGVRLADIVIYSNSNNFAEPIERHNGAWDNNAGTLTWEPDTPIKLPMWLDSGRPIVYYILEAEATGNLQSGYDNIELHCGCGSPNEPYMSYMQASGVKLESLDQMSSEMTYSNNSTFGLRLDVKVSCDSVGWMCENLDYKQDAWGRVTAKVMQLYTINAMLSMVLNSGQVNVHTTVEREFILQKRSNNEDQAQGRMAWLALHFPLNMVNCFTCKSNFSTSKMTMEI